MMPPWLAALNPYVGLASLLLGAYNANQARIAREAQNAEVRRQEEEARRRFEEGYAQLRDQLAGILSDDYRAISPELVDAIVGRAGEDIDEALVRAYDRILRGQARRGLAGHSLVDQRQAYAGRQAQEALADARLRAELEAANLTNQIQSQARNILANATMNNMAASQAAAQNLLAAQGQSADTFAALAGQLLAPTLERVLYPGDTASTGAASTLGSVSNSFVNTLLDNPARYGQRIKWNLN